MPVTEKMLVDHFDMVLAERMQGLPLVNERLEVEAVAFRNFEEHRIGVLITPWFMNLVLLPGSDRWDELAQGESVSIELPCGDIDFTVCRDDGVGAYLSAVLFRTVADFPDQDLAVAIAEEAITNVFEPPPAPDRPSLSRRELFTRLGSD